MDVGGNPVNTLMIIHNDSLHVVAGLLDGSLMGKRPVHSAATGQAIPSGDAIDHTRAGMGTALFRVIFLDAIN